jgi:hypothetical protein
VSKWISSIMVSAWMWKLVMMESTYDREVVAVSVVEEDVDPGTSFLAAACRSRSTAAARTRRCAAVAFSSAASTAATRASRHCLGTSASVAGRATMSDGMRTEEEEVEATRASSRYLRASASVAGRATMADDMTTGGEEEGAQTVRGTVARRQRAEGIVARGIVAATRP